MPNHPASAFAVKLSRNDKQLLKELVDFLATPEDEQPLTMSGAVRLAIRSLHETLKRRIARQARTA